MPPGVLLTVLGCAGFLLGQSLVGCRASPEGHAIGWVLPTKAVPFSWAGKLFVFTARKPLDPRHFAFTTRTFLLPCPSPGIQPYPQRFIFSKDSVCVGRSLSVYCGFSPYIAVKTIPVLGGRSLRVQGIHNILLPLGLQRLSGADGFYGACCHI